MLALEDLHPEREEEDAVQNEEEDATVETAVTNQEQTEE